MRHWANIFAVLFLFVSLIGLATAVELRPSSQLLKWVDAGAGFNTVTDPELFNDTNYLTYPDFQNMIIAGVYKQNVQFFLNFTDVPTNASSIQLKINMNVTVLGASGGGSQVVQFEDLCYHNGTGWTKIQSNIQQKSAGYHNVTLPLSSYLPSDANNNGKIVLMPDELGLGCGAETYSAESLGNTTGFWFENWIQYTLDNTPVGVDEIRDSTATTTLTNGVTINSTSPSRTYTFRVNNTEDSVLESCWYSLNGGANTTYSCTKNAFSSASVSNIPTGSNTITFWAMNDVGSIASKTLNFNFFMWGFGENSQTYDSETYDTDRKTFSINFSMDSDVYISSSASLVYDGVSYLSSTSDTGDYRIYSRTIDIPVVTAAENKTFYWRVSLTNTTATQYFNSSSNNQTVNPSNLSQCGTGANAINYTIYDEVTNSLLTADFEATFTWRLHEDSTTTKNVSVDLTGANNYQFCINVNETFYTDTIIEYFATGYASRIRETKDEEFTNVTTHTRLYLLNETDSTSFIVYVRDSTYVPVSEAIVEVFRYYPELDEYRIVESLETNTEGKSIGHFVTEDVYYRFAVYVEGVLQITTLPTLIFCEATPCTITITLPTSPSETFAEELDDLTSSLVYSKTTSIITYTYVDSSTSAEGGRLYVVDWSYGKSPFRIICNTTSTDTSAVLTCDLSGEPNGTYMATGYIMRGGESYLDKRIIVLKVRDVVSEVGLDGLLWGTFLIISLVMLGLFKPVLSIIFAILGVVGISLLGIASIPAVSLFAVIIIGGILVWEMRR